MKTLLSAAALGAAALAGTTPLLAQDRPIARADAPPREPRDPLAAADDDRDGVVSRDEAAAEADRRFVAMDTNRDGKIDRDERRASRPPHRPRGAMAPPPGVDGAPPPPWPGTEAPPPPGAANDGAQRERRHRRAPREMTRTQFRERALRMFDRADTNHDGRVDQQERESMRLMMRARRIGPDGDLRGRGPRGGENGIGLRGGERDDLSGGAAHERD